MNRLEYLKAVLPPNCRYSLRVIYDKKTDRERVANLMYDSVEELDEDYSNQSKGNTDIYYATAGFGASNSAAAKNAVAKQELYLDVDCGKGKPFKTQLEGLAALRDFAAAVGLPKATLMDTGNGYHAHWFFVEPVPVHEWLAIATALKNKCVELDFHVDNAVTADIVRVLRPPGSVNSSGGGVSKLVNKVQFYAAADLAAILGADTNGVFDISAARALTASHGGVQEGKKFLDPNRVCRFDKIWNLSVAGEGCAQIQYAIANPDSLSEPMWRATLSIAQVCEDRDWAIHAISDKHSNYDFDITEYKASCTKGPYTCETFQRQDLGHLCNNCQHQGKIKSPISLGAEVSTPNLPAVVPVSSEPGAELVEIPSYPSPFYRGSHGGVYFKKPGSVVEEGDDKNASVQVSPYDVYATALARSSELGYMVNMRAHLPNEVVAEFAVRQRDLANPETLKSELNTKGIPVFTGQQVSLFQWFMKEQIVELQRKESAALKSHRNGWTERNTFIIGKREYVPGNTVYSKIKGDPNLDAALDIKGSLDEWKRIINMYNNPDSDLLAFGVLCGFGSVLMHLSAENGGVVNYYSKGSGSGKTTVLRAANSIFGHPGKLMTNVSDTRMSKAHRMGLLNGIVVTMDEMTNATPEDISEALYNVTQGRPRHRMQAKANEERENNLSWKCISLWTANTSMENRMSLLKLDPQGELARMIEIPLPPRSNGGVLDAKLIFDKLDENYGIAGEIFVKAIVDNLEEAKHNFGIVQNTVYKMHNWSSTDRYRLNIIITAITAGIIARGLELVDFDMKRIMRKITALVYEGSQHMQSQSTKAIETIAAYVNKYASSLLVINNTDVNGMHPAPITEPRADLRIRYEPDTKSLFIGVTDFNRWCAEKQINTRELRSMFTEETAANKGTLEVVKKRLGKGWQSDFGPVNAYEIKNAREVLGIELNTTVKE